MTWFYVENGAQAGPVTDDQLRQLSASGRINGETLIWKDGMAQWTALAQAAPQLMAAAPAPAPAWQMATPAAAPAVEVPQEAFVLGPETALCSTCNKFKPLDQIVMIAGQRVCADCKPGSMQRIRQGETPGQKFRYAGFWIRVAASILDSLILTPVNMGIMLFLLPNLLGASADATVLYYVINYGLYFAYLIFFTGKFGATPGKMVVGVRVVRADGSPVGFGLAAGRAFASVISFLFLLIGYVMAAFDPEKRTLHDRICNTRVIYNR